MIMAEPEQLITPAPTPTLSNGKALLLLLALGLLAYGNSFTAAPVFDDLRVFAGLPREQLASRLDNLGRIVIHALFLVQHDLGLDAIWMQHALNLFIHVMAAFALYQLLKVLLRQHNRANNIAAITGAALFAVHPLATQSVTYVCQRYSSLAGLLAIAAIALYASARRRHDSQAPGGWKSRAHLLLYLGSIVCAHLAMFCKEYVVILPVLLLLIEWLFFRQTWTRQRFCRRLLYAAPLLASGIWVPLLHLSHSGIDAAPIAATVLPDWSGGQVSRMSYLYSQAEIVLRIYLQQALMPLGLNVDHSYTIATSIGSARVLAAVTTNLALLALAVIGRRRWPFLSLAILWFYVALAPTSSLIPNSEFVAEQRVYLALAGLCLAWPMLWNLTLQPHWRHCLIAVVLSVFTVLTILRNQVWQNSFVLWHDAVDKSPTSWRAHYQLAMAYLNRRDDDAALSHLLNSVELKHDLPAAWNLLGNLYKNRDDNQRAKYCYIQAVELEPEQGEYWYNLALLLRRQGELIPAQRAVNHALGLSPEKPELVYVAAMLSEELGNYAAALAHYRQALQLAPQSYSRAGFHYARLRLLLAQPQAALPYLDDFERQYPGQALTHIYRGRAYSDLGEHDAAIAALQHALQLSGGELAIVHYELARVLVAANLFAAALPHLYEVVQQGYEPPPHQQLYLAPAP